MPDPTPPPKVACIQVLRTKQLIQESQKTKKKRKTRYIKEKKERRKQLKALSTPHVAPDPALNVHTPSNASEDGSSDGETTSEEQRPGQPSAPAEVPFTEP